MALKWPNWPDAEVSLDRHGTLEEVMRAVLTTDPKVVTITLAPAR